MTNIIHRLHAVAEEKRKPVTFLPNRLTSAACSDLLDQLGLRGVAQIAAANDAYIDINDVDKALTANSTLSISDRMAFKEALTAHGIISRGRRINDPRQIASAR